MAADYVWLVEDALSNRIVADLPIVGGEYEHLLDRPGSLKGGLAMKDADANAEHLDEGRMALYVMRDGRFEQGGLIDVIASPERSEDVELACRGWFSWFDRRKIRTDRTFPAGTDQFTIVETLVADAQDVGVLGAGADLGFVVDYEALSGVTRERTEEYRWFAGTGLGTAIRDLAALDDGFDFDVRYAVEDGDDFITKTLFLTHPRQGKDYSGQAGFEFSRSAGFEYARNERTNVLDRGITRDASRMAWRVRQWGVGADEGRLFADAIDETKRSVYPFFDNDTTSNVSEQTTIGELVVASLASQSSPVRLPSISIDTSLDPAWISLWTGDTVDVQIDDGVNSVSGAFRILGFKMDADADVPQLYLQEDA